VKEGAHLMGREGEAERFNGLNCVGYFHHESSFRLTDIERIIR